ncbi:STS14 protein [Halotydeus destructor]|nr:STS14 protein [Halotydeus destructor]
MNYFRFLLAAILTIGSAVAMDRTRLRRSPPNAGDQNRIYPVSETTTWQLIDEMEIYQNGARYLHGTAPLQLNMTVSSWLSLDHADVTLTTPQLTKYAVWKAMVLAWYDGKAPKEGGDIHFGESIHWSDNTWYVPALDVVDDWYFDEEPKWDYESDSPQLSDGTADFSQMLWASSRQFGCGQAVSEGPKGGTYTVCYYDPPGNVAGQEKKNVKKPRTYRQCKA